jgi:hypothetical protein
MTLPAPSLRSSPSRRSQQVVSEVECVDRLLPTHMPATAEVGNAAVPGPVGSTSRSGVTADVHQCPSTRCLPTCCLAVENRRQVGAFTGGHAHRPAIVKRAEGSSPRCQGC